MSGPVDVLVAMSLSPKQVAEAFWAMDQEEQADFFAALERLAGWRLCFQMAGVVHEISERADRGDFDAMNGFQTMLSHAQGYAEASTDWRVANVKASIARATGEGVV